MKVVKFGGSSMADAGQYRKVRDILLADPERRVVVVSAAGKRFGNDHKLTDLLYLCYAHVQYGVDCSSIFDMIASRYLDIRDELGLDLALEPELDALKKRIDAKDVTQEELVSRGEYFSAKLMAAYLGFQFVDAADWVMFNMDGTVNREASYKALRNQVLLGYGAVIPGFYGAMPDGTIHTFSRGGSDITGALAAAALDADVYENWTDVSGILMADPRIVDDPQAIPEVTYDELRELSYSGAQVLHEDSIFPVREKNIPVNIRNTNDPDAPGTMIQESFSGDVDPDRFITGITGKKDFSIISLTKRGMSNQVGVLRRVLSVLERHNISVDYVPNGIDNVSVVLPTAAVEKELYTIMAEIKKEAQPDTLDVHHHIAVVAAVGRKMAFRPGISGRIFKALGESGINIRMINQGPDELNIIFGVDNTHPGSVQQLRKVMCGRNENMKTYTVAVLGATGAVGQEMIKVLQERNFPVGKLVPLASARSAGKTVKFRGEDVTIQEATDTAFKGVDIVLGAAENDIAKKFAPAIVASGAVFVDNSSAFRLNPEVPLIVPEVNPEDVKNHKGIISNPNCSTIITVTAVNALNTIAPIRTMTASTYQAVSGAGAGGPIELMNEVEALREGKTYEPKVFSHQIAFNLIPQIGGEQFEGYTSEEMKMQNEGRKIMHLPELKVSCTCVRVPVVRSHSISVSCHFDVPVTVEQAREVIAKAPGCKLVDDLKNKQYPMPLDTSDQDIVFVGRIRPDLTDDNGLCLWCCGDQVRKGAATNAIQIAELLVKE